MGRGLEEDLEGQMGKKRESWGKPRDQSLLTPVRVMTGTALREREEKDFGAKRALNFGNCDRTMGPSTWLLSVLNYNT